MDPSLMVQQGPNPGERFAAAFQQGQQTREQNMAKAAMAALVRDPNNQKALEALASVDPGAAQQFQQQRQQHAAAGLEAHRDNIIKGAQIIRQFNPKDDAGWQQALGAAQQMGIDVSQVPPHFDPQYMQSVVSIADTFAPQPAHNPQLVPFTEGGGVARLNPQTGQAEIVVQPNPGGHQAGTPVAQPLSDEDIMRLRGGQGSQGPGGF